MPTYITLARWTQQGIEQIKESPARLDAFKQLVESAGGKVKASKGSTRSETVRAFTEDEYRKIIAALQ